MPAAHKPIRWTIERAAREFGIDRRTLSNRLTVIGAQAEDGTFSTVQICDAKYGDYDAERTEKTREEKLKLIRERQRDEKQLLPANEVRLAFEKLAAALKSEILSSMHLLPDEKDSILKSLQSSVEAVTKQITNEESSS